MIIKRDFIKGEYIKTISGKEFRESGALWFVNQILHLFGFVLTWNPETDEIKPAICKFRGFNEDLNTDGYRRLSKYLKENIDKLEKETLE